MSNSKQKIIGWLTLKELPGLPAMSTTKTTHSLASNFWVWKPTGYYDELRYIDEMMLSYPDFFLPIYEGEEVCPDCNGTAKSPFEIYKIEATKNLGAVIMVSGESFVLSELYPTYELAQEALDLIKQHREENGL